MQQISKQNPIFKEIKDLQKNNKSKDLVFTDDLSSLKLAIEHNVEIKYFLYCQDLEYKDETKALIDKISKKANEAYLISKATFDTLKQKDNSVGIAGVIKMPNKTLDDFKNKKFIVVLDRLEIPGNIGTIYRTCEATNVDGVIIVDAVTKPNNNHLCQAARGANLYIDTVSVSYQEAQKFLLENNFDIFLGEPNLGKDYQEYDYQNNIAIVVGSERFGINNNWYDHLHKKVYIPMFGKNNSLNVGVAASILIYEAKMKREKKSLK